MFSLVWLCIPPQGRESVVTELHAGVSRMKSLARGTRKASIHDQI